MTIDEAVTIATDLATSRRPWARRLCMSDERVEALRVLLAERERDVAESAEARLREVEERLRVVAQERADARLDKAQILAYIQRWQPAGSPPYTDAVGTVKWIMGAVQEQLEAAEARLREVEAERDRWYQTVLNERVRSEAEVRKLREAITGLRAAHNSGSREEWEAAVAAALAAAPAEGGEEFVTVEHGPLELVGDTPERCNYCGGAHDAKDCAKCNDLIARHAAPAEGGVPSLVAACPNCGKQVSITGCDFCEMDDGPAEAHLEAEPKGAQIIDLMAALKASLAAHAAKKAPRG
jgi:hypothetical protein